MEDDYTLIDKVITLSMVMPCVVFKFEVLLGFDRVSDMSVFVQNEINSYHDWADRPNQVILPSMWWESAV
jgi:hypothetical protein